MHFFAKKLAYVKNFLYLCIVFQARTILVKSLTHPHVTKESGNYLLTFFSLHADRRLSMASTTMGKVTYSPGIQYVQGALSKPKKQDGHKHGDYLIGTHRIAATTNPNCTRLYIRKGDAYTRTTTLSVREVENRERFSSVAALIKARKADLSKVTTDTAAFLAQKDLPGGKKTMLSYYWMVCGQEYDESQG